MIVDAFTQFSNAQSVKLNDTTDLSTNSLDLGAAGTMFNGGTAPFASGRGQPCRVIVRMATAMTAGTSVKAEVVQADNAALSTNLEVLIDSGAVTQATAVAGYTLIDAEFPTAKVTRRYVGIRYTVAGNNSAGAGSCDAFLVEASESRPGYYP